MFASFRHFVLWRLGLKPPKTDTTEAELNLYRKYAKNRKCLVEIGVFQGVSAREIRKVMDSDATLYAIDPFFTGKLGFSTPKIIAYSEVNSVSNGNVEFLRSFSHQAARGWQRPVDFMLIDGDLSYEGYQKDWEAWSGLVRQGGVICLHASIKPPVKDKGLYGSYKFSNDVIFKDPKFEIVEQADTVTVIKKIA